MVEYRHWREAYGEDDGIIDSRKNATGRGTDQIAKIGASACVSDTTVILIVGFYTKAREGERGRGGVAAAIESATAARVI